ncbi:MAG: hypothetical protein FJY20_03115 [Bacteroidetes bacterium]|nr:hypothetical protein [Bacteroidota bacterium]
MKNLFLFAGIITAAFASCNFVGGKRVRGNGDIKNETRSEHGFQTIEVRGAINVFVTQDSAFSVKVEADAAGK